VKNNLLKKNSSKITSVSYFFQDFAVSVLPKFGELGFSKGTTEESSDEQHSDEDNKGEER
jgi:hypothetical protein